MKILHIFRKDTIRLWPQASIFLALLALSGWADRRYAPFGPPQPLSFLPLLLPIACSVLLIALVHEEGLVGDRKYWLSRPISRRQLVGAKVFFALVFINVPLFLYQAVIIVAAGLPLSQNWVNLLWLQIFFTAIDILPVAALAAVTKNMVQTILVALTTVAVIVVVWSLRWSNDFSAASGISWIDQAVSAAIFAAISAAILSLQYWRRAAMRARAVLAGGALVIVLSANIPFDKKWNMQMRRSVERVDSSAVRISWNPEAVREPRTTSDWAGSPDLVSVEIPIRIDDLPPGISVNVEAIQPNAQTQSGEAWHPGWTRGDLHQKPGGKFESISVDRAFYKRIKDAPVRLYGVADLTLLRTVQTLPRELPQRVAVPGIGNCRSYLNMPGAQPQSFFSCNSTLPSARLVEVVNGVPSNISASDLAPFPTSPGYSPLTPVSWRSLINGQPFQINHRPAEIHLEVQKPIAYIQRTFDFKNIRLSDYAMEPPARH